MRTGRPGCSTERQRIRLRPTPDEPLIVGDMEATTSRRHCRQRPQNLTHRARWGQFGPSARGQFGSSFPGDELIGRRDVILRRCGDFADRKLVRQRPDPTCTPAPVGSRVAAGLQFPNIALGLHRCERRRPKPTLALAPTAVGSIPQTGHRLCRRPAPVRCQLPP